MNDKQKNKDESPENFAFNYLRGKLTKWRIISAILFIILLFGSFQKINLNQKKNQNQIENIKKDFIAKIEIDHPIMQNEEFSVSNILEALKKLEINPEVKGILLEINSPGGTVVNSFELYDAINSFRTKTKKPVAAFIKDFGTSGAYLISIAADQIFANNVSIIGSIGVLMQIVDLTEFGEKIGIKMKTYRSGALKALPNPFEKTLDNGEPDLMMKQIIDDLKNQFFSAVKTRRPMISEANFKEIEKAGIFVGSRAKEIGLIDQTGEIDDVSEWFKKQNKDQSFEIIKIETQAQKGNLIRNILHGKVLSIFDFGLINQIKNFTKKPGFYFLFDLK